MAAQGEREDEGFRVVDRRRFTPEGEPAPADEPTARDEAAGRTEAAPPGRPEAGASPGPAAEGARPAEPSRTGDLPPASFPALVQMLAMSALDALGAIPGPEDKPRPPDLGLARHGIDLLGVLEAKTKGNLSADEARLLEQTLFDLRMLAVRAARGRA